MQNIPSPVHLHVADKYSAVPGKLIVSFHDSNTHALPETELTEKEYSELVRLLVKLEKQAKSAVDFHAAMQALSAKG